MNFLPTLSRFTSAYSTVAGGAGAGEIAGCDSGSRERDYEYKIEPEKFDGAVLGAWRTASWKLLALVKAA